MALHNPNNWHWVNKDVAPWTKTYLQDTLSKISAEEDGVSAKVEKVLSMDGDVDVSQRKTKDEETVTGTITIPEVAHDTEEDDFVFEISVYSESSSKQPVKDLVRSKIVPQLRVELAKLPKVLVSEHGKDIQHAPGSNPSSGFATPTHQPLKTSSPAAGTSKTTTSSTGKVSVNTTTVTASDEFRTTAEEMYTTFTDPQRIAAFTRGTPRQFEGAKVGGKFAIFDGNVTGEYVTLEPSKRVVQKWRLAQWPEGHFSTQEIVFDQNDVDSVTVMRVTWTGVPIGQEEVVQRNWDGYYVRSIKQTFGFGTIL